MAASFETARADFRKRGHNEIQSLSLCWRGDRLCDGVANYFGIGNAVTRSDRCPNRYPWPCRKGLVASPPLAPLASLASLASPPLVITASRRRSRINSARAIFDPAKGRREGWSWGRLRARGRAPAIWRWSGFARLAPCPRRCAATRPPTTASWRHAAQCAERRSQPPCDQRRHHRIRRLTHTKGHDIRPTWAQSRMPIEAIVCGWARSLG